MARTEDLEASIRESYQFILEYEHTLRLSGDPKEQVRCQREIAAQWNLIRDYLRQYDLLCERLQRATPQDIVEITALIPGAPLALQSAQHATPPVPPQYNIQIEHVTGLAIGDKGQVTMAVPDQAAGEASAGQEPAPTDEAAAPLSQRPPTKKSHPQRRIPRWAWGLVGIMGLLVTVLIVLVAGSVFSLRDEATTVTPGTIVPTTAPPTPTLRTPVPTPTTTVPASTPLVAASLGDIWTRPADGMVMVYVPAGEFLMGSADSDLLAKDDEKPQHTIYLNAYWIDRTEVTNAQFAAFLNERGNQSEGGVLWLDLASGYDQIQQVAGEYRSKSNYADHPVAAVSWYGAWAYCRWAGARLPTEAEWEKAARGTTEWIYPWGDQFDPGKCNMAESGISDSTPVGSYSDGASWCGALDMTGNAWEWTSSLYRPYPYRADDGRENPDAAGLRVVRGGSWGSAQEFGRCSFRADRDPDSSNIYRGFRCSWAAELSSP